MKKIISLLLILVILLSFTGCIMGGSDDYTYDEEGRVIRGPYSSSSYMVIEYGENGNTSLKTIYNNSDNKKITELFFENNIVIQEKTFDGNGALACEQFFNSKSQLTRYVYYSNGTRVYTALYEYDERGNKTLYSSLDAENVETEKSLMQYNSDNDLIRTDNYRNGVYVGYMLYEYSAPGVEKTYKKYTPGGYIMEENLKDNGKYVWIKEYTYDNGTTTPRLSSQITYKSSNSDYTQVFFMNDGRSKTLEYKSNTKVSTTYRDTNGNIVATATSEDVMLDANGNGMDITQFDFEMNESWFSVITYPDGNY